MASPVDSTLDRPARWGPDDGVAPVEAAAWRVVSAVGALLLVGAVTPVAVALVSATDPARWQPLVASTLVALLIVAPLGTGLAAAAAGLRRLAALAVGGEAEQAVWRLLVAGAMFGYALILPLLGAADRASARCVSIAAAELVAGWALLLCVILWPTASAPRRLTAIVIDLLLFSAFLHFGGRQAAGWYPLYIVVLLYAGLRFGLAALLTAAAAALAGFAAVAASTPAWHGEPALAAGLMLALIVLPMPLLAAVRRLQAARVAAADADAERRRVLIAISQTLRGPGQAHRAGAGEAAPIADIVDFAALETGDFALPVETFELRALIRRTLSPLQAEAAERGVALRWRVDPHLPNRLRGHAQAVTRILRGLSEHAIAAAPKPAVRLLVGDAAPTEEWVCLELRVDGRDGDDPDSGPLALRLVRNLAAAAGGSFAIDRTTSERPQLVVNLPLAVEAGGSGPVLDLDGRPVLIVSESDALADLLTGPIADWNGVARWPADADQAIAELAVAPPGRRAVAIIDGRDKLLPALVFAHQAARLGVNAPFVLLVAEAEQVDGLLAVDDGGIDGLIPAPPSVALIANALDALPLASERARPQASASERPLPPAARPPADPPRRDPAHITPIAVHPKFAPEAAAVDARALEGLQALGGDEKFLDELIEAFRIDTAQIMERVAAAAAAGDPAGFAQGLVALRRAAGQLGGVQLCALTASLQHLSAGELRRRGSIYVRRLDLEIDRLTEALTAFAAAEERRS